MATPNRTTVAEVVERAAGLFVAAFERSALPRLKKLVFSLDPGQLNEVRRECGSRPSLQKLVEICETRGIRFRMETRAR